MTRPQDTRPLAVRSYVGVMDRSDNPETLAAMWDRMLQIPGNRAEARRIAGELGVEAACATFHVFKLRAGETYPTGADLLAEVHANRVARKVAREAARAREAAKPRLPWPECYEAQFKAPYSPWS